MSEIAADVQRKTLKDLQKAGELLLKTATVTRLSPSSVFGETSDRETEIMAGSPNKILLTAEQGWIVSIHFPTVTTIGH